MANSCDKTGEFAQCPDCSDKEAELVWTIEAALLHAF
ncbi:hypothetical protein T10_12263 [Trichinella papuae]|uniref:Uncharacterized protein n=1 Tax=Trichinella papuae TaxID=268474 RepID=A0A0V1M0L0_9BILA|nr:hypothetical protein T10_12263 [Trichinella papuae]